MLKSILPASISARLFTCGPPGMDRHVEPAGGIGAVRDRLVEAAMFGLGQPVGAEHHGHVLREGRQCQRCAKRGKGCGRPERAGNRCHDNLLMILVGPSLGRRPRRARGTGARDAEIGVRRYSIVHGGGVDACFSGRQGPDGGVPAGGTAVLCAPPGIGAMRVLAPASIRPPFARYAHGVEVPPGARIVMTSGQLGIGIDDVVPETALAQAVLCFANCAAILAEAGMGPD